MTYIIAHCVLCGDTLLLEKGRDDNLIYPPVCRACWEPGAITMTTDWVDSKAYTKLLRNGVIIVRQNGKTTS